MKPHHLLTSSIVSGLTALAAAPAAAQHEGRDAPAEPGSMPTGVLQLPMSRAGSGTAWLPDATPMRAAMFQAGGWHMMLHGNLFVGYDRQASDAGESEVVSQNWLMLMAGRPLGAGHFEARAMLSLEPATTGRDGYPLLLQTGESLDGQPLIDRQHPHDLFMEIAARYSLELTRDLAVEVYAAPAGEPALGPVAFPHRPAAIYDPLAPLSHHWQDSTHISFGVLTAGIFTRTVKVEGSWFNGREPDDERYDLDLAAPDSYATRISVNPSREWSLQASYGYLASPEELRPDVSIHRLTASAVHARPFGEGKVWTSTLAFGQNMVAGEPMTHGGLVETALGLGMLGTTFLRAEHVIKGGEDFAMPAPMDETTLSISSLSVGHVHRVATVAGADTSLGIRGAVAYVDAALESRYGTRTPLGFMAYVQVQPSVMEMGH